MGREIEDICEIADRLRREGRSHRPRDVEAEWLRQVAWCRRELEDEVLAMYPDSDAADQIRDHRQAGHWTIWFPDPPALDKPAR